MFGLRRTARDERKRMKCVGSILRPEKEIELEMGGEIPESKEDLRFFLLREVQTLAEGRRTRR